MDRVSESIEALADALTALHPNRNTIVETLHGFARYVIQEHKNKQIEMDSSTNQYLDDIFHSFRKSDVKHQ